MSLAHFLYIHTGFLFSLMWWRSTSGQLLMLTQNVYPSLLAWQACLIAPCQARMLVSNESARASKVAIVIAQKAPT